MDECPCSRQFNARSLQGLAHQGTGSQGSADASWDAAPNPGPPDTSYGIAGAWDWRSCDQASLQRAAQKSGDEKGPGLVGRFRSNLGSPPATSTTIKNLMKNWPPPTARPRAEARGGCPPPLSHPLEGGRRAGPEIPEKEGRERERKRIK